MNLTVVMGPMFAGKSTFIINKINSLKEKYIAIKPLIDNRYSTNEIVSHDKKKIDALTLTNLLEFLKNTNLKNFKNIFIDEAQFFYDLEETINFLNKHFKGNVFVCGLNGDFKRKSIGYIKNIISRANNIIFLKGKCFNCSKESVFSLKLNYDNSQIDVGGEDKYQPVCGNCYQHFLTNSASQKFL